MESIETRPSVVPRIPASVGRHDKKTIFLSRFHIQKLLTNV